ncbi:MAG: septal ring lytic transglycosylase RlpA family protein [Solirubrobacteraceae bacterium]
MRPRALLRHARPINLIVVSTALAAPASALALGQVATARPAGTTATAPSQQPANVATQPDIAALPAPGPLNLRASRRHLRVGQQVRLTGSAPAADAGRRALLERQVAAGAARGAQPAWRSVASTRVDRNGRFHFRLEPRRSASYRAVIAGAPVAWLATAQGQLRVTVAARFHITRRWLDLLGGGRVSVRGRLAPAQPGRLVVLERRTGRGWRRVIVRRTGRNGGFWVRWSGGGRLPAKLRILFPGDSANASTAQRLGIAVVLHPSVASWYYDAGATACGFHATYGVANRTLPCGTHVTIRRGSRSVTAVVDDRGPFVWGRTWDLNQNTAAALGFAGVGTVWVGG